jgi:hypothetical protein
MAEALVIDICLTSKICEQVVCSRNRVFVVISKHL